MHGNGRWPAVVALAVLGGAQAAFGAEAWSLKFAVGTETPLAAETEYGCYPAKGSDWAVLDIAKATPPPYDRRGGQHGDVDGDGR